MKNNHLNEDQLIYSVIDSNNLSEELINHLSKCYFCREQKEYLEKDLSSVSVMAQKYTPVPERQMRYAEKDLIRESPHLWNFRTSFAAAATMVILILGIWFISPFTITNNSQVTQLTEEEEIEEQLMAEIWDIEEDYLMGYSIATDEDSEDYSNEEFWEFLVPFEEEKNSA